MPLRFNPWPQWPLPAGFQPDPGWTPDPSWPPVPPGWPLWVNDDPPPPPPRRSTNGFAIASLIFGIVGGVVLSVIFGLVALSQIRRRQQDGKGMAIAGLALSGAWIVLIAVVIAILAATSAQRSASGQITRGGTLGIFSLRVGDCFQNPSTTRGLANVSAVPCTTPHDAQVFAVFSAGSAYPGRSALISLARTGCHARAAASLDRSKVTSTMSLRFFFPEATAWADGHHAITCLVTDTTPDITSSLLAAGSSG